MFQFFEVFYVHFPVHPVRGTIVRVRGVLPPEQRAKVDAQIVEGAPCHMKLLEDTFLMSSREELWDVKPYHCCRSIIACLVVSFKVRRLSYLQSS